MYAQTNGAVTDGLDGRLVTVEVNITAGLPHFDIVGLPNTSVREARERVRAAITNSGLEFPMRRIVVNLAPAELKKNSAGLDLAICMGILGASGQIKKNSLKTTVFVGELSLEGKILPVTGVLAMALAMDPTKVTSFWTSAECVREASLSSLASIHGFSLLRDILKQYQKSEQGRISQTKLIWHEIPEDEGFREDLSDVQGQEQAKRALLIAAAGGHNVVMSGPPGGGKTMLAKRMGTIMPNLSTEEIIEVTKIYSIAGLLPANSVMTKRPFRSPHHTITTAGMAGGGNIPKPGEITLSHKGILFLDEAAEFSNRVLEILRQPVEEGVIHISRQSGTYAFPAKMIVIMALNPCPCGYNGYEERKECLCSEGELQRYRKKISGPLSERMDVHIRVTPPEYDELTSKNKTGITTAEAKEIVCAARNRQFERLHTYGWQTNSEITAQAMQELLRVDKAGEILLRNIFTNFHISARTYHRILKVARTIADLEECDIIASDHIAEAAGYRGAGL